MRMGCMRSVYYVKALKCCFASVVAEIACVLLGAFAKLLYQGRWSWPSRCWQTRFAYMYVDGTSKHAPSHRYDLCHAALPVEHDVYATLRISAVF